MLAPRKQGSTESLLACDRVKKFTGYRILAVICLATIATLLSDYALYLFGYLPIITALFLATIIAVLRGGLSAKKEIIFYSLIIIGICIINITYSGYFNGVLFSPILAYLVYKAFVFKRLDDKAICDMFYHLIVLCLVVFSVLELMVKLDIMTNKLIRELILNTGDGRLDVLRIRSPFGSPLSLAALLFVLLIYFVIVSRHRIMTAVVLILLILTGSRTSFVSGVFLLVFEWLVAPVLRGKISLRVFLWFSIGIGSIYGVIDLLRNMSDGKLETLAERVLVLDSYNLFSDASFLGRADTTVLTFTRIVEDFPYTLLFGLSDQSYVSDSAIVSLMAGSGIIATLVFLYYFYYRIFKMHIAYYSKFVLVLLFLLQALMIGDAFVPFVSFCFFLMTFVFEERKSRGKDLE